MDRVRSRARGRLAIALRLCSASIKHFVQHLPGALLCALRKVCRPYRRPVVKLTLQKCVQMVDAQALVCPVRQLLRGNAGRFHEPNLTPVLCQGRPEIRARLDRRNQGYRCFASQPDSGRSRTSACGRHEPQEADGQARRGVVGDRPRLSDRCAQHTCLSAPTAEQSEPTHSRHRTGRIDRREADTRSVEQLETGFETEAGTRVGPTNSGP